MLKCFVTFLFLEILIISSEGQIPWVIDYKREAKIIREYLQEHRKAGSRRVDLQVDHFLSNDKIYMYLFHFFIKYLSFGLHIENTIYHRKRQKR